MQGLHLPLKPRGRRRALTGRIWLACGVMALAAGVLLIAVAFGAPLVSILLVGLLLLCPLLLWAPFRIQQTGLRTLDEGDPKGPG